MVFKVPRVRGLCGGKRFGDRGVWPLLVSVINISF